ncbi:hypothetical protein CONLIGDRAFT_691213 [Coniochaeta ligniaria NRRL 30616]|uniref:Mid2 domain-containing protein n=1 Tax=Coniochaeta ligniaria NRRL 30616 TaxID=1408157 RepID=A0A1J7IDD8_9PEZI|nr:hypothetical protein CONLIGDRAFT_691213 [Coniochaeta ligniaria NRRL 30616]
MMRHLGVCLALLVLALSIRTVSSDDNPAGTWFNPPGCYCPNPVYAVGETIELHWATPYPNYSIALWQSFPPGAATLGPIIYRMFDHHVRETALGPVLTSSRPETFQSTNGFFNWSVSPVEFNLSVSNVFFFWLFSLTSPQGTQHPKDPSLSSHYFNLTEPEEAVTTAFSPSASSSTTASSTYVSASVSSSPNTTTNPTGEQAGSLSSGVSAGIGLGITIAVICLIAGALWWYRRQRRKRRLGLTSQPQTINHFELPACLNQKPVELMQQNAELAEAGGQMSPIELESPGNRDMLVAPPMSPTTVASSEQPRD